MEQFRICVFQPWLTLAMFLSVNFSFLEKLDAKKEKKKKIFLTVQEW